MVVGVGAAGEGELGWWDPLGVAVGEFAGGLINPAATQRQVQALTAQLFTLTTSKAAPGAEPPMNKRARLREATNRPSRAS